MKSMQWKQWKFLIKNSLFLAWNWKFCEKVTLKKWIKSLGVSLFKFHANFVPDSRISIFFKENSAWNWKILKKLCIKNSIKLQGRSHFKKKNSGIWPKMGNFFVSQFHCFHCFHCNDFEFFIASLQWIKMQWKSPVYYVWERKYMI